MNTPPDDIRITAQLATMLRQLTPGHSYDQFLCQQVPETDTSPCSPCAFGKRHHAQCLHNHFCLASHRTDHTSVRFIDISQHKPVNTNENGR